MIGCRAEAVNLPYQYLPFALPRKTAMPTTWAAPANTAVDGVWERALRALAHGMLRLAAALAHRRVQRTRRHRVLALRRARRLQRAQDRALRHDLARRLSAALRRDLGL